ncbi:hypothetical protein [Sphingopyxis macrogoltabida]|uniref:Uncharacterized protein n=1 Tax=Sphingopyxis macrogoltabida TaxID=33050 RepID=A0A0N9V0M5_SPHMC|nr:hypothetical protein [Sphingopyxis macrogoltabida]ALH82237.1 hypothetical protein AN936_18320 [Sphingopyxis macrogoltabida]
MSARRAAALRRARGILPKKEDIAEAARSHNFSYRDKGLPTEQWMLLDKRISKRGANTLKTSPVGAGI